MKITLEIPDTTRAAYFNYVWIDSNGGFNIASQGIDSDDLARGEVVCTAHTRLKEGDNMEHTHTER